MITKEEIEALVMEKIAGTGIFLVDVNIHPGNSIIVHIDKADGMGIEECVEISRFINANLDREIEDYELEVSSPGLGSAFKVKEQYLKNIGRDVEVIMKDGIKYQGKLLNYTEKEFELKIMVRDKLNKKSRKLVDEKIVIENKNLKSIKSIISFK
jgi:ribosome maturation factor RimP